MAWLYIDDPREEERIALLVEAAEETVSHDLDYASLRDCERADGTLPADLIQAILIQVGQGYASPDGMRPASVGESGRYDSIIRKHARVVC